MKKEFKTKKSITFLGRMFTIMFSVIFISYFKIFYTTIFVKQDVLLTVAFLVMLVLMVYYFKSNILDILYPLAFGKLIISDEGVTYRCFLKKPIFISWGDCGFLGVEEHQQNISVMKSYGNEYIYFSESELSEEYKGHIDKKKNGQGFIRFYPVTRELCEEVLKYKQSTDLESFVNKNDNKINWYNYDW